MSLLYYLKSHDWGGGVGPLDWDADVKRKKKKEEIELQSIFNTRKKNSLISKRKQEEDLLLMLGEFDA